jgi:hypothetical protein
MPAATPMSHASNRREALDHQTGDIRRVKPEATAMAASVAPQTPEEAAALRELAATYRRRHRWLGLGWWE